MTKADPKKPEQRPAPATDLRDPPKVVIERDRSEPAIERR